MCSLSSARRDRSGDHPLVLLLKHWSFGRVLTLGIAAMLSVVTTAEAEPPTPSALLASSAGQPSKLATNTVAGFRMEGIPQIGSAFGDIASYKRRIDEFSRLESQMGSARRRFADASHDLQLSLRPPERGTKRAGKLSCPALEVADSVAAAVRSQAQFEQLGVALERGFHAIRDLHRLGESSGLTPDYRLRALQSGAVYKQALRDLREMSAVMRFQLSPALARHHCNIKTLLLSAAASTKSAATPTRNVPIAEPRKSATVLAVEKSDLVTARPVAFIVDNKSCSAAVRVYVDGIFLGSVDANADAAFQGSRGRASLCLLNDNSKAVCGASGTVRNAFLHDGLRLARTCGE